MLSKLAVRNAKRSVKDYLIYMITVILSFSLIIAFNLIVYSRDVQELSNMMENFKIAMIVVSVIMVFVIGWLINYTMKFMFSKRSKEFGTYMLLGIERKDIIKMFLIENILLGIFAFVVSIFIGYIFSDLLTAVIMNIFEVPYKLNFSSSWQPFVLSIGYFVVIYVFVMFMTNRRMRKIKVYDLLYLDRQNEEKIFKNNKRKKIIFVISVVLGILALTMVKIGFEGMSSDNGGVQVLCAVPILILSIYGITITAGDFIIDFVINRKNVKYRNDNLFIVRQFTSKIKTMGVTLGTLSLLITLSLVSLSSSIILSDSFNTQMKSTTAYDIMISEIYTECPEILELSVLKDREIIKECEKYIQKHYTIKDRIEYNIYTTKKDTVNKHITDSVVGYIDADCFMKVSDYNNFMKVSDYNKLMDMRGLKPITLGEDEFFIYENRDISKSIDKYLKANNTLNLGGRVLKSNGHTSENYVSCWGSGIAFFIIVPDDTVSNLKILDRFIMMNTDKPTTEKFYDNMCKEVEKNIVERKGDNDRTYQYLSYNIGVKGQILSSNRTVLTIFVFVLLYVAFIFTAIVATILAIQALSDETKYKYQYSILAKLGVEKDKIYKTIRKQLIIFFLFPIIYPILINISVIISLNQIFGPVMSNEYMYLYSIGYGSALFLFIYLIYFIATYFSYKKNVVE